MDEGRLRDLLEGVRRGKITIEVALERLRSLPFEDLGYAKIDHHRPLRQGLPEIVLAQGKRPEQVATIISRVAENNRLAMATRADAATYQKVKQSLPEAHYYPEARIIAVGKPYELAPDAPYALVLTGGTADLPVAEEAAVTAELLGVRVKRLYDVGVSGIHRLLAYRETIQEAGLCIVVAGMEGALASVVGGLVSVPVIAVPTSSAGYGTGFGGLAALLAMLNSCTPGVAVVNIDNGLGAGVLAWRILIAVPRSISERSHDDQKKRP